MSSDPEQIKSDHQKKFEEAKRKFVQKTPEQIQSKAKRKIIHNTETRARISMARLSAEFADDEIEKDWVRKRAESVPAGRPVGHLRVPSAFYKAKTSEKSESEKRSDRERSQSESKGRLYAMFKHSIKNKSEENEEKGEDEEKSLEDLKYAASTLSLSIHPSSSSSSGE